MHAMSYKLCARVLKFHTWIPHGKIADPFFFIPLQEVLEQPVQRILGDKDNETVGEIESSWSEGMKCHENALLQKLSAFKVSF